MIEYRKKEEKDKVSFVMFGTDPLKEPGFEGLVFNLIDIPYLATSTRRCFSSAVLYPHFPVDKEIIGHMLECTDGWEKTDKSEYNRAFDEALSYFHITLHSLGYNE